MAHQLKGEKKGEETQDKPQETSTDEAKPSEQDKDEDKDSLGKEKTQDPISEHFYTLGSVSNILSWGDHPIPQPVEEVADLEFSPMTEREDLL
jgi:hypothetical protein